MCRRALLFPACLLSVYADDLAPILRTLFATLARFHFMLRILRKTVLAPLYEWQDESAARNAVTSVVPTFAEVEIAARGKYLGVFLGCLGARGVAETPGAVCDVCVVWAGAADRARRYARCIFSALGYLVPFRAPGAAFLGYENRTPQQLVGGSWQAVPCLFVRRSDMLRLPAVPTLAVARLADRARLVFTAPVAWEGRLTAVPRQVQHGRGCFFGTR